MIRMTQWLAVLVAATLLAACGGSYTTARSVASLATPTPDVTRGPGATTAATSATTTAATSAATSATTAVTSAAATAVTSVATTAATSGSTSAGALPDLKGRKVLIGSDTTYPPFESVVTDTKGTTKIVGFDVDLMDEIGKLINIKPEFQTTSFDSIFQALSAKQFDAVVSAVTITDERKQKVDFSDPYVTIGQMVVTLKQNTAIKDYNDLSKNNYKVGVQRGTTGEQAALKKANVTDTNVKRYDDIAAAFADLKNNAIDAIVADGPTIGNYGSQPEYKDAVQVVGTPFTTEDYGIAVQKGDKALLDGINAGLAQIKKQGKIDDLKKKYNIK